MYWTPISELKDKYQTNLLLRAPELVDLDCNTIGFGPGYWQDDGLCNFMSQEECNTRDMKKDYGCFLAAKWSMTNDEWYEVACKPTHFMIIEEANAVSTMYWRVEEAARKLQNEQEMYLQRWGWRRTCNTPGAFWLWVRDFRKEDNERIDNWRDRGGTGTRPEPYGIMKVPLDLAVRMTVMSLDEQPECNEEEDDG